jgi:DNA-binding transcriptional MerR regulator
MPSSDQPVYSIGAVSKLLGVPTQTLRTWQERYGVVVPERSAGGHRLYSRDQLELLRFLADRVAAGLSPGDAHRLLREQVAAGLRLPSTDNPVGSTLLILLAEHDPYAAEFAEYFLRTEGYNVESVMGVDDVLAKVAEMPADLVVIDLLISGGHGRALCVQLRERTDVPILAISTLELRDDALEAGASAFLQKPIAPLQLVSTVKDLLGRSAFIRRAATES